MQTPTLSNLSIRLGGVFASLAIVLPIMWTAFIRPQLVLAADLAPVKDKVHRIHQQVQANSETGQHIKIQLFEIRIENYQEKIRELESKATITVEEDYRLKEYRDKVEKLERQLRRLEA